MTKPQVRGLQKPFDILHKVARKQRKMLTFMLKMHKKQAFLQNLKVYDTRSYRYLPAHPQYTPAALTYNAYLYHRMHIIHPKVEFSPRENTTLPHFVCI